ncbi:MAG TPA: hypothetical protein VKP30_07045 [Polyangiaceae bacterium]|nr:hypothetical protein [Polyangiaceae bacterium]
MAGDVDLGQVLRVGACTSDELDALTVLVLIGLAAEWPNRGRELTHSVVWLETYTGLRCLTAASTVLDGARLRGLAELVLEMLQTGATDGSAAFSAQEIQIGRSWLASLRSPDCGELSERARQMSVSPDLDAEQSVRGNLGPPPRHPAVVTFLALTGILFVMRGLRALGRLLLLRRTPTSVSLSERGLELVCRNEMLGRVLSERRLIVPIEDIRSVEREVRFPRLSLYAGLLALALGSLLGTQLFVDGLRVSGLSFPMIGIGLLLVVLGVALDLLLTGAGDSLRGRCRLVVVTYRGKGWAIGDLEPSGVDRLLTKLSTRLAIRRA